MYRFVCVGGVLLKIIAKMTYNRLYDIATSSGLIPDEQFGFQKIISVLHAVTLELLGRG